MSLGLCLFALILSATAYSAENSALKIDRGKDYALPGDALGKIIGHYEAQPEGPYQVMIEVIIFEVFLRNSDSIGFVYDILGQVGEFWGTNLAGDPTVESDLGVLGSGSRNELLPAGANIVSNIFESNDENRVAAVFQALAEDQVVQVYSNPRLLTIDGIAARLETGEEISVFGNEKTLALRKRLQRISAVRA